MSEKKKGKIWNRLFFKVYLNYAFMVILFAIILGVIFLNLSEQNIINEVRDSLFKQGETVSKRYTEFITNREYSQCYSYLEKLREVGADEIWSVANPVAQEPMNEQMVTIDLRLLINNREYQKVIEKAFSGQQGIEKSYSEIYGCDIITVSVPVKNEFGEVCGAILINRKLETQAEAIATTTRMIIYSALIALFVSFIVAFLFARQVTRPIQKMRYTALKLADQKYEEKTGITRKDEIGDLAKTIDFLTDRLTENEKIRKNLDQMRFDFFANVSHELRTPITVVRAYTESLVDGVITKESDKQQYYSRMLAECKSMERLVGDLLTLSKMQNPDFNIEEEPVNLIQIFDDISRTIKQLGEEKKISIQFTYDNPLCMMLGDYDRLRQMFLVICDNAIKFSNENSTIYIGITTDSCIRVSIRDEGIGISKEDLPNIFDKFYKSKLRQNAKGSGLGLAIARQIAWKHKGTIQVKSEQNVGTEFIFTFQKAKEEELEQ